jgi:hypothetical protein
MYGAEFGGPRHGSLATHLVNLYFTAFRSILFHNLPAL